MTSEDEKTQSLIDHLTELRKRLIWSLAAILVAFVLSYSYAGDIYAFLVHPLAVQGGSEHRELIYTGLAEAFITHIKLALWAAVMLAFPMIASQIWMFVAPGLYKHEKQAFWPFLLATPVLFFLGAWLAYGYVMPTAWKFFLSFESAGGQGQLPIHFLPRVAEYLSLSMGFILAFGLSFQMPVLLLLLVRAGLVPVALLVKGRRYAIVINFIIAAVLTPPDVFSQLCLAIPLVILYEISILLARFVEPKASVKI